MITDIFYKPEGRREYRLPADAFNLIIGRSGSGKTLFLKSLFAYICHTRTGVPLSEIKSQMRFNYEGEVDVRWDTPFEGSVFFIPSCDAYLHDDWGGADLPLHIRKTVGVYRSWMKRGFDFESVLKENLGITASHGGLLKTKVFVAIMKEIRDGDILLVDLPEAGLDATVWKWWIDEIVSLVSRGVQVFLTTHDFFVYTYVRSHITRGNILYFTESDIQTYDINTGIPENAAILRVPLEVLESAM